MTKLLFSCSVSTHEYPNHKGNRLATCFTTKSNTLSEAPTWHDPVAETSLLFIAEDFSDFVEVCPSKEEKKLLREEITNLEERGILDT